MEYFGDIKKDLIVGGLYELHFTKNAGVEDIIIFNFVKIKLATFEWNARILYHNFDGTLKKETFMSVLSNSDRIDLIKKAEPLSYYNDLILLGKML